MEKVKECDGCIGCDPYSYKVEVDAFFLKVVESALKSLRDEAPEYFAPGWLELTEDYIKKLKRVNLVYKD